MSRRWVLIGALVALAVAAVPFARFLTADRELVASTPSPRPVFQLSYQQIGPHQDLCIGDVTIPADARRLRMQVRTYKRPGPQLTLQVTGRGYTQNLTVAPGYEDLATLDVPMPPPAADTLGKVCVTQDSANAIALVATNEERTQSRPQSTLDGGSIYPDSYLAFYAGRSADALTETPAIVDHMQAFKPGVVGSWLLWPLLVLTIVGVPAGVLWAALRAVRA